MIAAALCLLLSALVMRVFAWMCRPVKHHDLTRPHEYLDQVTREPNNELARVAYEARMEAGGHAPVREVRS